MSSPAIDVSAIDLEALASARETAKADYAEYQAKGLKLDVTRGKPCAAQLDLSEGILDILKPGDHATEGEGDLRNYGGAPQGLKELREVFSPLLGIPADQLVIRDNSSLSVMYQCLQTSFFHAPSDQPGWAGQSVKFLAPAPGYDRHFTACKDLGIELVTVPMTDEGPDMDVVEQLVKDDASIKGIWCVPKYSNPTGVTFSDAVVKRLAAMTVAAPDFRIYWDNAYAVHHLRSQHDELTNVLDACAEAGNPDRVFCFASTSKVTFAGGGISFFGASPANVQWFLKNDSWRSIGPDKINQLRHLRFFPDSAAVEAHMEKHREIVEPKFDAVLNRLDKDLASLGVARWTDPNGGYFISLDVVPGTAQRVVQLAKEAGVALTPAGATFPGEDPNDENIRLAPTMPTPEELEPAMAVVTTCVVLAAGEKLLD